jgi:hypothetical protein
LGSPVILWIILVRRSSVGLIATSPVASISTSTNIGLWRSLLGRSLGLLCRSWGLLDLTSTHLGWSLVSEVTHTEVFEVLLGDAAIIIPVKYPKVRMDMLLEKTVNIPSRWTKNPIEWFVDVNDHWNYFDIVDLSVSVSIIGIKQSAGHGLRYVRSLPWHLQRQSIRWSKALSHLAEWSKLGFGRRFRIDYRTLFASIWIYILF